MDWIYLVIAGIFEVGWAVGLKYSEGFTKISYSIATVLGMIASFYCLSLAMKTIPLGTAYAIWTGIGTVGAVILGIVFFAESVSIIRIFCIMLIAGGILGLKLTS